MIKKQYYGITLICFGGISGAIILVANTISRGQIETTLVLFALAVSCVVLGSIIAFSQLLDRLVEPVVDLIDEDIKDDLEDIKAKRLTNAQLMVIITGSMTLIVLMYVLKLHKFEATWGIFPVVIPSILAAGAVTLVISRTSWFHNQKMHTPLTIFFIPLIGIVLSMFLGISRAEDVRNLNLNFSDQATFNDYIPLGIDIFGDTFGSGIFDIALPVCDDDVCAVILLVVALIVLTFVMVIGSAFIPHFWFLSAWVLLTIMTLITIHEIRIRPTTGEIIHSVDPYRN